MGGGGGTWCYIDRQEEGGILLFVGKVRTTPAGLTLSLSLSGVDTC